MIPRTFHYVWVGGAPLPQRLQDNIATWLDRNRGYRLVRWDESNLDFSSPILRRVYRLGYWARVADIARLQILYRHGGIYLDVDVKVIGPFDPLLSHKCFVGLENESYVSNAVIGAEPGNAFIGAALSAIQLNKVGVEKMDPSYGPVVLTDLLLGKAEDRRRDEVFLAPKQFFHPLDWDLPRDERSNLERYCTPETVCVHLFDHSWKAAKKKSVTFFLQTIIRLYPRIFRNRLIGSLYSQLIFLSEMARGRVTFILRKMPWQQDQRVWRSAHHGLNK